MVSEQNIGRCLMALDYGERRIGVAICRHGNSEVSPLTTVDASSDAIGQIKYLIGLHRPDILVVGRPRGLDGQSTAQTKKAEAFAGEIAAKTGLDVKLQDETLTTVEAEKRLPKRIGVKERKALIDQVAAQIILEDFLHGN